MPDRAVARLLAVLLAAGVGVGVAARGPAVPAAAPECGDAPTLRASPLHDRSTPGSATPSDAVATLVAALGDGLPDLADLDLRLVEGSRVDGARDGDAVVVGRRGGDVVLLGHVVGHVAGGWQVDVLLACKGVEDAGDGR